MFNCAVAPSSVLTPANALHAVCICICVLFLLLCTNLRMLLDLLYQPHCVVIYANHLAVYCSGQLEVLA